MYGTRNRPGSQTPEAGEAAEADEVDPYDIIPEDFCDNYDAATIDEALSKAERADSTTDPETRPRCPECDSMRLREKVGLVECEHQRPERFCCNTCGLHFNTPRPPPAERDE